MTERTKPILCKDLCAILTTIKFMSHMVFLRWKWLFLESDWASWIAQNENDWTWKHDITPQSKTKQSDKCTVIQMTFGATPPIPICLKIYVLWNCNWSDVRFRASSMSTPWGKTYIHETEVTGWLSVLVWLQEALLFRTSIAIIMCS